MLKTMQHKNVGAFLAEVRRRQGRTLHHIAKKIGRPGISKQALSLIERGRMKLPTARLASIRRAYRMSIAEEEELARLYAFETLIENTGEDREFGEAVLSVVDPKKSSSIYVLGARKVALTSRVLIGTAARFLEARNNSLTFFYPKIDIRSKPEELLWFHNTERERRELRRVIEDSSRRSVAGKIRFFELDTSAQPLSPLIFQLISLCGPFTAITVTNSLAGC